MPVTWNFYIKRKRINLNKWFDRHQIKDYSTFLSILDVNDVIPPKEEEVSSFFVKTKRTVKNSKNQSSNGMAVDKEGFLVAEQIAVEKKKPVRKKRAPRVKKAATKSSAK